jgi:hypothetical protein
LHLKIENKKLYIIVLQICNIVMNHDNNRITKKTNIKDSYSASLVEHWKLNFCFQQYHELRSPEYWQILNHHLLVAQQCMCSILVCESWTEINESMLLSYLYFSYRNNVFSYTCLFNKPPEIDMQEVLKPKTGFTNSINIWILWSFVLILCVLNITIGLLESEFNENISI